jgi:hypothetical protein
VRSLANAKPTSFRKIKRGPAKISPARLSFEPVETMAQAQQTLRAGTSKVARTPSPVVLISDFAGPSHPARLVSAH